MDWFPFSRTLAAGSQLYAKNAAAVFRLQYHVVWYPKVNPKVDVPSCSSRRMPGGRIGCVGDPSRWRRGFTKGRECPTTFPSSWKAFLGFAERRWSTA